MTFGWHGSRLSVMAHIVVMGVTGCGKSTVGRLIAQKLHVPFADGDDFHPEANIAKMSALIPLTDRDRWPWLADIGQWLVDHSDGGVIACSALKNSYRDAIRVVAPETFFVHLAAPQNVLEARVRQRSVDEGHFAGTGLLDSQYADLEQLSAHESGITIDVATASAVDASEAALKAL